MKTAAVICEYNPFHWGHAYHLQQTRLITHADSVLCLMSGNFVQRGEPSILDKYARTEVALQCGADAVVELPPSIACSYAPNFALGAIRMLNAVPSVDALCFGIESGTLTQLQALANYLLDEPPELSAAIRDGLKNGLSYPRAQADAAKKVLGAAGELLDLPNNILALEYLKALRVTRSKITPFAVDRIGDGYHALTPQSAVTSATAIREKISKNERIDDYIPPFEKVEDAVDIPSALNRLYLLTRERLLSLTPEIIALRPEVKEGLQYRLASSALRQTDYTGFVNEVKTKRFTRAAISRILVNTALDAEKAQSYDGEKGIVFNVLGHKNPALLQELNPSVLSQNDYENLQDFRAKAIADEIVRADRLYNLICAKPHNNARSFFTVKLS